MTKTHTVRGDVGMDGSTATSLTERTRQQISRAFVNKSANDANTQGQLFEQLLSLSFKVQPPPVKQPEPSDSTVAKSASANTDKKETAKADEEKDDDPTVVVANLTQVAPPIAEKLPERKTEQPVAALKSDDGQVKSTELNASKATEQPTATTADSNSTSQLPAQADQQVVAADTQETNTTVDTTTTVSVTGNAPQTADALYPTDDSSSNKVAPVANKTHESNASQPHELTDKNKKATGDSALTEAQHEIAVKPQPANAQSEDRDDRRGDRREKWFERKDDVVGAAASDRPSDIDNWKQVQENADAVPNQSTDASSPPLTVPAPTDTAQPVASTIAPSVALPVTVSLVPQATSPSVPTAKETPTSSPESTNAVSSAPSRTVGTQAGKANSKEKVTEPGLSQQERVRVIQRIARSFNRISTEGGSINLRLHPENLGSVSVQVRLEGKSLSARLSTETTAARDAIMQDLPALRQRLADQGFDVTKFQVDVAGNGADASFAQSGGQSQSGQSENRSSGGQMDYRRFAALQESRAAATRQLAPIASPIWQSNSGIDLQA